jgi:multiple sugar transport system permease protein
MAPGIGYLIPWFILFTKAKMIDTYTALIPTHHRGAAAGTG